MSSYGQVKASLIASTMPAATLMQNNASANGAGVLVDVKGYATLIISIKSSTPMSGGTEVRFESSVDDITFVPILGLNGGTLTGTSTNADGDWVFNVAGQKSVRARIASYSAGVVSASGYVTALASGTGSVGSGGGAVTQSGTWLVKLLDSAGTNQVTISSGGAIKTDSSATIQPVSASSLPLPSGASTAAKQPTLGTAGTASADVLSIQGIASMVPVKTDGSAVTQPVSGTFWQAMQPVTNANLELAQNSTTSGQSGPLVQGAVTTSAPSYTNAKTSPISLTTGGAVRVDASGTTVPVSISGNQASNITQIDSNTVSTGNGAANSGTQRVAIANDSVISAIISAPTRSTYSATTNGSFAHLASATDMIILTGSATTTVKILEIRLSYEVGSTAAGNGNRFFLVKRSSANSGGTATTETMVSMDSNNSAATAVMKSYRSGSNPTLGTTVGTIWSGMLVSAIPSGAGAPATADFVIFRAVDYGQPIVLRGTAQSISLNNGGVTVAGSTPKIGLTIYFTEE